MPGKMSNRDRIAHKALEAEVGRKEKAAKKEAEPADKTASGKSAGGKATGGTVRKSRSKAAPARIKIVWAVCDQSGAQVKLFPYAQEQEAQAEAQTRTASSGKTHFVTRAEVPFE